MSAVNGVGSHGALEWKVGLCKKDGGKTVYLTAEKVQNMINASAPAMKSKQLWTIEHDETEADVVYLKSHLGYYLAGDRQGNVTCGNDEKTQDSKYVIQYDGTGRWAFKNRQHGLFFGGNGEYLHCNAKSPGAAEWWTVRLAVHPQVNIRNLNRKRYAHLHEESKEIHIDESIPWGQDALLTLEFNDGKYAVKTSNNKYLNRSGELVDQPSKDTLYTLELKSGQLAGIAFKDCNGLYLTAIGKDGVMKSKSNNISKDEIFTLEDSHPQAFLTAHNNKKVSIKQGVDISANQSDISDTEIFQIEHAGTNKWRFRTSLDKYWVVAGANGVQREGNAKDPNGLFELEYLDDGGISLKATNGMYVSAAQNGSLYATSKSLESRERFVMTIVNRPLLVLRCEHGFMGLTSATNSKVQCNKATYDLFTVEPATANPGQYYIKGPNGQYWDIAQDNSLNASSGQPKPFRLMLCGQSKFVIKAENGQFLKGEQNGIIEARVAQDKATKWEF